VRASAPPGHLERNRERLAILVEQRDDLAGCLVRLWQQVLAGERRFKLYRQLKMYNDATLNPVIYGSPSSAELSHIDSPRDAPGDEPRPDPAVASARFGSCER
jgi:hypothetical protein